MLHTAVFVTRPDTRALEAAIREQIASVIDVTGAWRPLSPGRALETDVEIPAQAAHALERDLRAKLAAWPVDLAVLPAADRRKRLFIADMDSTMIGQECIDELAAELGLKDRVATITERAMRGDIDFEPALRERVALLRGLPVARIETVIAERIRLTPGGRAVVSTMRAAGAYTALVSGGFTLFTGPISRRLGFDEHQANHLIVADGRLTGTVREPVLGRAAKRRRLDELIDAKGLKFEDTLAAGDGANDLAMLQAAGLGVAFRAKPVVAQAARARIDHTDLRTLLYFQGYRDDEIKVE